MASLGPDGSTVKRSSLVQRLRYFQRKVLPSVEATSRAASKAAGAILNHWVSFLLKAIGLATTLYLAFSNLPWKGS